MSNPGIQGPRLCFGAITSAGAIARAGSGDWTVALNAGLYVVTFDVPFLSLPAVSLDGDLGNLSSFNIFLDTVTPITVNGFQVRVIKSGALAEQAFDFVAVGT